MATFQERDGKWRAIIRRTGHRTASKTFANKELAKAWARQQESKLDHGQVLPAREMRGYRLSHLIQRYRDEVTEHRPSAKWDRLRLNKLLTYPMASKLLSEVVHTDFQAWRDERLTKVSGDTVNREMNLYSGMFTHAIKEWGFPIPFNPVRLVKRPPKGRSRTRTFTKAELEKLVTKLGYKEGVPPRLASEWAAYVLLLCVETAMRLGECCEVLVENIHLDERWLYLPKTKNGDDRNVPLSNMAVVLIMAMLEKSKYTLVPFSKGTIGLRYREARNELGLKNLRFHDSRHTATTQLSKKVKNPMDLAKITGHRDTKMLLKYYHPDVRDLAGMLD